MELAIWGFIGTLVGALASIVTTLLTNWNTSKIKKAEKEAKREECSKAFQRKTILELQDELTDYMRLFFLAHFEHLDSCSKVGRWGSELSSDLDEKLRISNSKTSMLIERVSDDDLRETLKNLKSIATSCLLANSKEEAEKYRNKASDSFEQCSVKLGTVLRNSY